MQSSGQLQSRLQLPDVPRPRGAGAARIRGNRRPPALRCQPRLFPANRQRSRHACIGILLPAAGRAAGHRADAGSGRRPNDRRTFRHRAELPLLGDALRCRSQRAEQDNRHQRTPDDHRRHCSTRLRGNHNGRPPRRVRPDHDANAGESLVRWIRQSPKLLGVSLRAAQAGRVDRAG